MRTKKLAFLAQTYQARNRGIPFKFTFEQWCAWWESELGPDWFQKRGCHRGEYVMARKRDKGPYAVWNVKCITADANSSEMKTNGSLSMGEAHWMAKINDELAFKIKQESGTLDEISARLGVGKSIIKQVKSGHTWAHVDAPIVPFTSIKKMHKRMDAETALAIYWSEKHVDELAKEHGVRRDNIMHIKRGRSWRKITKGLPPPPVVGLTKTWISNKVRLREVAP